MFESALSAAQGDAEGALRSAASLTRELRKAKAAAATGQVREYRRALGVVAGLLDELSTAVREAQASFDIDETAYLASGDYAKELLDLAAERGVAMFEEDERLLCYPSIVRVVPGDSVVEIDRRRERRLRPSVLIGLLALAGARRNKDGRILRWHASSGTRTAEVLTTVARTGQQQRYWGVSFTSGAPQ